LGGPASEDGMGGISFYKSFKSGVLSLSRFS
jgi:hypothetical protein